MLPPLQRQLVHRRVRARRRSLSDSVPPPGRSQRLLDAVGLRPRCVGANTVRWSRPASGLAAPSAEAPSESAGPRVRARCLLRAHLAAPMLVGGSPIVLRRRTRRGTGPAGARWKHATKCPSVDVFRRRARWPARPWGARPAAAPDGLVRKGGLARRRLAAGGASSGASRRRRAAECRSSPAQRGGRRRFPRRPR